MSTAKFPICPRCGTDIKAARRYPGLTPASQLYREAGAVARLDQKLEAFYADVRKLTADLVKLADRRARAKLRTSRLVSRGRRSIVKPKRRR